MLTEINKKPIISVILPVYNAGDYLILSIESILKQTFTDFELIIINDGSTDNSLSIISSFADKRIKIINNKKNLGLIDTLNIGIDSAGGKYIARMDQDDISLSKRFEKQVNYLENNTTVSVVATRISFINSEGEITGKWGDDTKYAEEKSIRYAMAFSNCIAHPSVMIRSEVYKKYKYKTYQKSAEDWDLWLRIFADGKKIHKLDEELLNYRIHPQSIMSGEKKNTTLQQRLIKTKCVFLIHQLPKLNSYFILVFYSLLRSIASHFKFNLVPNFLRAIKRLLTSSPIAVMNQYFNLKKTLAHHKTNFIFLFPYTHIGGAERVHADIVSVFKSTNPLVIFTGFSKDKKFLSKFSENAILLNIPDALNYPFLQKKTMKLLAGYINSQANPHIIGSNSGFFYDLTYSLSSQVNITDILHAFKYQPEGNLVHKKYLAISQKFTNRIFISSASLAEFKKFCFHQNLTKEYTQKLKLIYNCTTIPVLKEKVKGKPLQILFVGRDSEEKRLNIFIEIAKELYAKQSGKFNFTVIGAKGNESFINYLGEINDDQKMKQLYDATDILLLTSSREGFPLVIMEAMAHGVVPLSTPVGDIPAHIKENSGFITSGIEENLVISEMIEKIEWLYKNRNSLANFSANAYTYASTNFSKERFASEYKSLLNF